MLALGMILFVIVIATIGVIWKGIVLSILWAWFLVAPFGLPELSTPLAIGITLIASLLTHQYVYAEDEREITAKMGAFFGMTIVCPAAVLGIGWIVKGFM